MGSKQTFDLCHISHSSNTESEVFPVESPCDRSCYASLACARRAVKTDYLSLSVALDFTNCNKLLQKANRLVSDQIFSARQN